MALEASKHFHMDSLIAFSNAIKLEKEEENDQNNVTIVTSSMNSKKTGKSKFNIDKFNK